MARTITLEQEDFDMLLLALGYAAGAASARSETGLFIRLLEVANKVNAGNPNWTPYEMTLEKT